MVCTNHYYYYDYFYYDYTTGWSGEMLHQIWLAKPLEAPFVH